MEVRIANCPFCGNESPSIRCSEDESTYWVECSTRKCTVVGPVADIDEAKVDEDAPRWWTKKRQKAIAIAVAKWNRRQRKVITNKKARCRTWMADGW